MHDSRDEWQGMRAGLPLKELPEGPVGG